METMKISLGLFISLISPHTIREMRKELNHVIEEWASAGYRTLALAYMDIDKEITLEDETEENPGPLDKYLFIYFISLTGI